MHLDSYTILVAGCAVLMLQGAIFLFFWFRDRSAGWLLLWGLPLVLGGAAISFYLQTGWDTEFVPIALGNAIRMLAVGCLWQGIRLFEGRRLMVWPLVAVSLGWVALCLVPAFAANMLARVILVSLINGAFCALAANELRRGRAEDLPSRRPLMAAFVSFAVVMAVRIAVATIAPFPMGAAPADPIWVGVFVFVVFVHTSFAAILFFAMTREKREAEQRNFALSDPLTGLLNRRAFSDFAERLNRRRSGQRSSIALLVLDLDHFKSVNDRYGHEVGDRMLKAFAEVSEASVRPSDQLFRMGGEEFCFVLPETGQAEAIAVAERIRRAFETGSVRTASGTASATVSIGIATTPYAIAVEVLLAAADAAVYEAKSRGRNRVVVAEPSTLMHGLRAEPAPARLRA